MSAQRLRRAPTVKKGQAIRAQTWNRMADVLNGVIQGPRDLDAGTTASTSYLVAVTSETTEPVRVENPDDAEQYVDIDRTTAWTANFGPGFITAVLQGQTILFKEYKAD